MKNLGIGILSVVLVGAVFSAGSQYGHDRYIMHVKDTDTDNVHAVYIFDTTERTMHMMYARKEGLYELPQHTLELASLE